MEYICVLRKLCQTLMLSSLHWENWINSKALNIGAEILCNTLIIYIQILQEQKYRRKMEVTYFNQLYLSFN